MGAQDSEQGQRDERGQPVSNELLPCPFCGCAPIIVEYGGNNANSTRDDWYITCTNPNCVADGGNVYSGKETAINAWNTRPKLQIVVCYAANGSSSVLAVKQTKEEAEDVQRRWIEIIEDTDIQAWSVGEEMEMQP